MAPATTPSPPAPRPNRASRVAIVAVGLLVVASCSHLPGRSPAAARPPTVVRVVDGDTVVLRIAGATERVRLIGIDTPETVKPDTPVQCYGPEASAHLKHLLPPGTPVRVRRDAEARDRYGRLLLYLWRASDGRFVNLEIAADGFGRPLTIAPNTAHRADIAAAASRAEASGRGLWRSCPAAPP